MFFKRILPLVSTLLFFIFLELANRYPLQMLYWGLGAVVVATITLFLLRRVWLKEKKDFKIFWSSVFLFLVGSFLTFIFLDRPLYRQVLIFSSVFLFFLLVYYSGIFLREKKDFYIGNLTVLNEIFPVLAVFFLVSGFFGWLVFLNKILWIFLVLFFLVALETSYNLFYNSLGSKFLFSPLWVSSLISAELFWALYYLPVGFLVKGIVLTVVWWAIVKILIGLQKERKNKYFIYFSPFFAILLIIIILLSSRWI